MHELSFTKNILSVALRHAQQNDASKVNTIFLRIGILRDLEPDWVRRYFRYVSKGTAAENAEIFIMVEPVVCKCNNCGEQFGLDLSQIAGDNVLCPSCSIHDYELVAGMEFIIQGIEVA